MHKCHAVAQLVEALRYKPEGSRIDSTFDGTPYHGVWGGNSHVALDPHAIGNNLAH